MDDSDDRLFYAQPRFVVHIDEQAIAAIGEFFQQAIPADSAILDLMSSWRSHFPAGFAKRKLIGLGLNEAEMADNPQLDEWVVHDLNANPILPFQDESFDAVVLTVSVQYLVKPIEVFQQVNRILKAGGPFHVVCSNRMFPTKAVAIWQMLDDRQRVQLVASYFVKAGGWETPQALDLSPRSDSYADPVYVVTARKQSGTSSAQGLGAPGIR